MIRSTCFSAMLIIFHTMILFSQTPFETELQSLAESYGGKIGIMAQHLQKSEEIALNAHDKFPSASVIKISIMVEFFQQVADNKIDPQAYVVFNESDKWGGSGILQYLNGMNQIKLIDAVTLMIILSDNSATNLVIDALGSSHETRLRAVNLRMISLGLENTRLLNKMMSWETKTDLPESIRYGVGVTTPRDMVLLLEKIARSELPFSEEMMEILKRQQYNSMIPRYLPSEKGKIEVAHKTGGVTETKIDAGIVTSEKGDYVVAIFCDESDDHRSSPDNAQVTAAAKASRLIWNYFTGDKGLDVSRKFKGINWSHFPKGKWAKIALKNAPFPHPLRIAGFRNSKDEYFSAKEHYLDGCAIVVVPEDWHEDENGINLIVHFHGHGNEVLRVLEKFKMPQQLIASGKNAILILAQGPKNAPDSFGGKMEDPGGFRLFVNEILEHLKEDETITSSQVNNIIISAHSGGYRPAAFILDVGGLTKNISEIYLFDAFYGQHDKYLKWVKNYGGKLISVYTEHLSDEHKLFTDQLEENEIKYSTELSLNQRLTFYKTEVCHSCVIEDNFKIYLKLSGLKDR